MVQYKNPNSQRGIFFPKPVSISSKSQITIWQVIDLVKALVFTTYLKDIISIDQKIPLLSKVDFSSGVSDLVEENCFEFKTNTYKD